MTFERHTMNIAPRLVSIVSFALLISGCSTIDIQKVEPEKLAIDVVLEQTETTSQLDVYVSRGLFNQPVRLSESGNDITYFDGTTEPLVASRQAGRYGFRAAMTTPIDALTVDTVGTVQFPEMAPVVLTGREQFEDQLFLKDDVVTLTLPSTPANERVIVASGVCGGVAYTTEQAISTRETDVEIALSELMNGIDNAAEHDLSGVIPVTLAIEERYQPLWPAPFEPRRIASRDSTQFRVDTSGFRFQAKISMQVENVFLRFQNQSWPVKYCF